MVLHKFVVLTFLHIVVEPARCSCYMYDTTNGEA